MRHQQGGIQNLMSKVFLLIGGNEGNRDKILSQAIKLIGIEIGKILKTSSIYQTEPWGFRSKNFFLNQAIILETRLSPQETLNKIIQIESGLGRMRHSASYESRPIDIDILFYDHIQVNEIDLQIPHPRLHRRKFTLIPLIEIAADFVHPIFEERMDALANKCEDNSAVELYVGDLC